MKRAPLQGACFLLGLLLGACGDAGPLAPPGEEAISVMARNLYVGADFHPLLEITTLSEVPAAVALAWSKVQATNFPERAGAVAAEIDEARPHLIGIQEAALFRIQSPGDFLLGNPRPAADTALDYLTLLLDSLDVRGLSYRPVIQVPSLDLEAPMLTTGGLVDLRITDHDVILVRSDVPVTNVQGGRFREELTLQAGDEVLTVPKAWASADATVGSTEFRFVTVHLEIRDFGPDVQVAQAGELLEMLEAAPLPVVLLGDFNSAADGSDTPTYGMLLEAGFVDAWSVARPGEAGFTCCQAPDLRNPASRLEARIDLVLTRGAIAALEATRTGADATRKTPSGLWPSDHAGVATRLEPGPAAVAARRKGN